MRTLFIYLLFFLPMVFSMPWIKFPEIKLPKIKLPNPFKPKPKPKPTKPTVCRPTKGKWGSLGINPFSHWKRDCSEADGAFKSTIPTPPFSSRGQIDDVYKQEQLKTYEKDLIMKSAEMAEMGYHVKNADPVYNLRTWDWNHRLSVDYVNRQAKHLKINEINAFEIKKDGFKTTGFVAKSAVNQLCWLVVKGSDFSDVTDNFKLQGWPHSRNYYRPFLQKAEHLMPYFTQHSGDCKHFIFTGHGTGGAIAAISAIEMNDRIKIKIPGATVNLITFGSTRAGSDAVSKVAHKKLNFLFQIVNSGDLVPTMPPLSSGFTHLTWTSKISGHNSLSGWYKLSKPWNPLSNSLLETYGKVKWLSRLRQWIEQQDTNHSMTKQYIRLLRRIFYEQEERNDMV